MSQSIEQLKKERIPLLEERAVLREKEDAVGVEKCNEQLRGLNLKIKELQKEARKQQPERGVSSDDSSTEAELKKELKKVRTQLTKTQKELESVREQLAEAEKAHAAAQQALDSENEVSSIESALE